MRSPKVATAGALWIGLVLTVALVTYLVAR